MQERSYRGKRTLKAEVLDFVESRGGATFTEIQRFIVEKRFGKGEYDKFENVGVYVDCSPNHPDKLHTYYFGKKAYRFVKRRMRVHRGCFTSAFRGYFRNETGYGHLELGDDRIYRTVRPTK